MYYVLFLISLYKQGSRSYTFPRYLLLINYYFSFVVINFNLLLFLTVTYYLLLVTLVYYFLLFIIVCFHLLSLTEI